jgi:hypothetical protein
MESRNALLDFSNLALSGCEVLSYLEPETEGIPAAIGTKPDPYDPFDDATIDTSKWAVTGTVTEQAFLGVDGLTITGPATPGYDQAGVIYKPAITAAVGKTVLSRYIMSHPTEFAVALQEYAFTVDSVVTPTTWTLKYLTAPQDLRNSMGLIFTLSGLFFFEGGDAGNKELLLRVPSRVSRLGEINPIQAAFVFTASGFDIYVHLPGYWDQFQLVKSYARPGGSHASDGYSLCVNAWTADDDLHFYDPASSFKSNTEVLGARILAASEQDQVVIGSMSVLNEIGTQIGGLGSVGVRIPDYSSSLLTLEDLAQVTEKLTGKNVYEVEFVLTGDAVLKYPVRVTIEDQALPLETDVTPS